MNRSRRGLGFTVVELLVVIATIVLLVAIMMPAFRHTVARARSFQCKSNLYSLAQILQLEEGVLPAPGLWVRFARSHGGQDVLACPSSTAEELEESARSLAEVFIVQNFTLFTNVQDALERGRSLVDRQIRVNPPGITGSPYRWNPPDPGPNQDLITIDDEAAVMITHGNPTVFESIDPPGEITCISEHWVVQGDGSPEWIAETNAHLRAHRWDNQYDDRVLMRLTGRRYIDVIDPPAYVTGVVCSYGMNDLVMTVSPRLNQLLLVDYGKAVADMGGRGNNADDLARWLARRHFGKANFVRVDGSVGEMTLGELQAQLHRYENENSAGEGLWGP